MKTGHDFIRAQVNNCLMQHQSLLTVMREHSERGDEPAFRELCTRHIPMMDRHQRLIEAYATSIGTAGGGAVKNVLGAVFEKAKDVVESFRESDFLRVVGDIVMIRQAQDTFAAFAHAGEQLGERGLAELGRACEADHEMMQREFNAYVVTVFVAQARAEDNAKDNVKDSPDPMSRVVGSAAMSGR